MNRASKQLIPTGKSHPVFTVAIVAVALGFTMVLAWLIPEGGGEDFLVCYYRVGRYILQHQTPYAEPCFYNPPWIALFFVPFALLPINLAWRVYLMVSLLGYVVALRRLDVRPIEFMLIAVSPFILISLYYSNIDWIIILGATLPPAYGIWLVSLKPQLGVVVIAMWIWQTWKTQGVQKVLKLFGPIVLVITTCIGLGLWRWPSTALQAWSADIFPYGIPVGMLLAYLAFRSGDPKIALAAAPCLSPYVSIFSWTPILLPATRSRWLLMTLVVLSWLGVIIWRRLVLH